MTSVNCNYGVITLKSRIYLHFWMLAYREWQFYGICHEY